MALKGNPLTTIKRVPRGVAATCNCGWRTWRTSERYARTGRHICALVCYPWLQNNCAALFGADTRSTGRMLVVASMRKDGQGVFSLPYHDASVDPIPRCGLTMPMKILTLARRQDSHDDPCMYVTSTVSGPHLSVLPRVQGVTGYFADARLWPVEVSPLALQPTAARNPPAVATARQCTHACPCTPPASPGRRWNWGNAGDSCIMFNLLDPRLAATVACSLERTRGSCAIAHGSTGKQWGTPDVAPTPLLSCHSAFLDPGRIHNRGALPVYPHTWT